MEKKRNFANIGRQTKVSEQNMQHFMSNSPWSGPLLMSKVREEVGQQDEFQRGSMLLLDESADDKRHTYTFSNAPSDTSLLTMAQRKSARYFVERSNQDMKTELGWDEFQAIKLRAWEHQLAMTILASWFITHTRLDWGQRFERDPDLLAEYEVDMLPALSLANVRAMLVAALPLSQLSPQEATYLVVKHLDNRTRSRKSRLRSGSSP
jgi:SRSO17 transposase